ncbi:MAG: hypothetical protein ACT4O9_05080 [Blastocatellia bacterium]
MPELNDFINDGFGWVCRHCHLEQMSEPEAVASGSSSSKVISRLLCEGEAESKSPRLSTQGLAKWADPAQTTLTCPRCGITELVEKS